MQKGINGGSADSTGSIPSINYKMRLSGSSATHIHTTAQVMSFMSATLNDTSGDKKEKSSPNQDDEKLSPTQFTEKIADIVKHLGMIEIQIGDSISLSTGSPYSPTMAQLNTNISAITKNSDVSGFQTKMLACKNDLLEWKDFLSSESCLALDSIIKKLEVILGEEIGLSFKGSQGYIAGIRQDGLELIKGVMSVREINGIETQGKVNFNPEKRVLKKEDSLRAKPPDKRGTTVQVHKFIDFINFFIQKVDLVLEKNQLESRRTKSISDSNRDRKDNILDAKQEGNIISIKDLIVFFQKKSDSELSTDNTINDIAHIIACQRALNLLGITVATDGIYDTITIQAIQKFQIDHNLEGKDGVPGSETTKKILEKLIVLDDNPYDPSSLIETKKIPESPEKQIEKYLISKGYAKIIPGRHLKDGTTIVIKDGKAEISWLNFLKNKLGRRSQEETEIMKTISDILEQSLSK